MFNNPRFATRGICCEVDSFTQLSLWGLIDSLQIPKDYLQIFRLSSVNINGVMCQRITHEQEQPAYRNEIIIPYCDAVNLKIFCIDDGDHSTMLLASEY